MTMLKRLPEDTCDIKMSSYVYTQFQTIKETFCIDLMQLE